MYNIHCSLAYVHTRPSELASSTTPCRTRAHKLNRRQCCCLLSLVRPGNHACIFSLDADGSRRVAVDRQPLRSRLDRSMNTMLREVHCRAPSSCSFPPPAVAPSDLLYIFFGLRRRGARPTTTGYIHPPPVGCVLALRPTLRNVVVRICESLQ